MWPFGASYPELSPQEVDGKTYDYIIVGGGTAGCILANQLSEDPNISVLVLEKGRSKDSLMSRSPLLSQNVFAGEYLQVQSTRWSDPIPGANGRRNRLWAAEALGGASRINGMLWTRGSPADYESWSEMGLTEWGWKQVEPWFLKLENAVDHPEDLRRGHDGPIELRQDSFTFEWAPCLQKAAENVGLPVLSHWNVPDAPAMAYMSHDVAIDGNRNRVSAFNAFLSKDLALQRQKHLFICTKTIGSRLEIDESGSVTGVYIRSSVKDCQSTKAYFVRARREVILCSGAICTAQLLLLSGIGPASSGDAFGIPLVKELPVGSTLSDHYSCPIQLELPRHETLHMLESIWGLWHLLLWIFGGTGIMGQTSMIYGIFARISAIDDETMQIRSRDADGLDNMDAMKPKNVPNLEVMVMPNNSLERAVPGRSQFSLYPTLSQPFGIGRVELADGNPLVHPSITYPMLNHKQDVLDIRKAVRFTMRLADEFQHNSGYPHPAPFVFAPGNNPGLLSEWERYPAKDTPDDGSPRRPLEKAPDFSRVDIETQQTRTWKEVTDEEIDDYVKRVSHTSLHFSCTCPMSKDATTGVVDQKLRVHGVGNLRIADTSVFPRIPSGHTMAPVMMVALRCADFIKDAWKK